MGLLPLCGPPDDGSGLIPPGPTYMTPDPMRAGDGRLLAAEAVIAALSQAAAATFLAQLHLDDLAEVLEGSGPSVEPALGAARVACTAARRSLRAALLALAALRDRLVSPPREPRRRC